MPCHDLLLNLKKVYNENHLETQLKHYVKYQLLIINKIVYLPLDRIDTNLLFKLITKKYEMYVFTNDNYNSSF
ncbi:MAG: ATP-binding protein [Cetobacterium sp.]